MVMTRPFSPRFIPILFNGDHHSLEPHFGYSPLIAWTINKIEVDSHTHTVTHRRDCSAKRMCGK